MRLHRLIRNRALGLSRRLAAPAARWRAARPVRELRLEEVRRRLELLVAAMYGETFPIVTETVLRSAVPEGASAERRLVLPASIDARSGRERAAERYRLMSIEQAERLIRGTLPAAPASDPLARDLHLAMEGAHVDRAVAARAPGSAGALAGIRRAEAARRPRLSMLRGAQREVERLVQSLLAADLDACVPGAAPSQSALETAAWARGEAARIRSSAAAGRYRGPRRMPRWLVGTEQWEAWLRNSRLPSGMLLPSDKPGDEPAEDDSADGEEGSATADGARESASSDRAGTTRGAEGASAGSAGRRPGDADADSSRAGREGIGYREWDAYGDRYLSDGVTVRARAGEESDDAWAAAAIAEHAPLVRSIRARFEALQSRRVRLRAQRAGDELDLDSCVSALVDRRMRRVPTDRLYLLTRPARRPLAIVLLVDASGSTDAAVSEGLRVIDVERLTVLLAAEALDALGDPYAVLAFSGCGRHDVEVRSIKAFADRDRAALHRRLGDLVPMDNTRLGAAVRHATAVLNAQPAERRLLLVVSDGRPNDVGGYQGSYAVEDSRRAILEARAAGVHPFCITVDREETEYLPRIFGDGGYRIMRDPAHLPEALLQAVARLLPV